MLFRGRFHVPIARGEVTRTVRTWSRPQARIGGHYNVGGTLIEVTAIEQRPLEGLSDEDARRCGLDSLDALFGELRRAARDPLPPSAWVIHFRAIGPRPPRPSPAVSPESISAAIAKLEAMDSRAPSPWTARFLALIGKRPGTAARYLAEDVGLERLAFKADVRKLKALGLTNSLEVGYELTDLGRAVVEDTKPKSV
jgi:hypothetical protein